MVQDVDSGGGYVCVEKGGACELFVLSSQFCYEQSALQIKFIKIYEQISQILTTSGYTALPPLPQRHLLLSEEFLMSS